MHGARKREVRAEDDVQRFYTTVEDCEIVDRCAGCDEPKADCP